MSGRQDRRAAKKDRTRRRRWYTAVNASDVSPGCKAWLHDRGEQSDDCAKIVYGNQVGQGQRLGRCERTIRTYRKEAEDAGLVLTLRSPPERSKATGQWSRRYTNAYAFTQPSRARLEARAAARTGASTGGTPTSDLPAAHCRSTLQRVPNPGVSPGGSPPAGETRRSGTHQNAAAAAAPPRHPLRQAPTDPETRPNPAVGAEDRARARAALRCGPPREPTRPSATQRLPMGREVAAERRADLERLQARIAAVEQSPNGWGRDRS